MKCPRCQHENPTGQKFCGECGTPGHTDATDPAPSYTDLHHALSEALEQRTATAEILRIISGSSPADVQPVFDAIVSSAVKLCDGLFSSAFRFDGQLLHVAALHNVGVDGLEEFNRIYPLPPSRDFPVGRAILERAVVHISDAALDPENKHLVLARAIGWRSALIAPMLREGVPIGVITVGRAAPGTFSESDIALLETFARQAVIAIENVRLFTELEAKNRALTTAHGQVTEALEQQTATSEILRVISSSPTDVQPVFDAIAASATRLCEAVNALVVRVDEQLLHLVAHHNVTPKRLDALERLFPGRANRGGVTGRVVLTHAVVHVEDVYADPEYTQPQGDDLGYRTALGVPMLREGVAIGLILVARDRVAPFSGKQIALLQTFADQAVIAIENVRLFKELEARNRNLTEALEQQTATSEILRIIAHAQTDVQSVFDAIVRNAVRLCGASNGGVYRFDGDLVHSVAHDGYTPDQLAQWKATWPRPVTASSVACQAIRTQGLVQIPDIETTISLPHLSPETLANLRARGTRSVIAVPMWRQREVIGAISLGHRDIDAFSSTQVDLLTTFADQAVIAIENVRLFTELEARNRDLTEALEQQTATAEILRVISRSPTDVQPVFDTIVGSAVRLCDGLYGTAHRFDGELVHLTAHHDCPPDALEALRRAFPMRPTRHMMSGRAILTRAVVHVEDVLTDPEYARHVGRAGGFRGVLAVPMLREGDPIGAIVVIRAEPGPFSAAQIDLLQTFADQAVIAVENVRLFKELEARTGELTRSVDQLTALGEISQAVSSTLDVEIVLQTIVSRASQLAGADGCAIYEYDDATEAFHIRATHNLDPVLVETLRAAPLRKGEGAMGRATETREPTQVADIAAPGAYQSHIRDTLLGAGYRALLSVPLLREGEIIGSLSLNRHTPGEFPPEVVEVLKTFATQSALAIQNARLFREIADKSRQLEVASQHKSEFLANMSHELRTPLNAIIGFSEVLAEKMFGDVNAKQAEYLQDILESGRHLLSLINDILDLSKIEAGHMELEAADFDLPSAIDNALTLVRERATRHGITLGCTVDERLGLIRGDERKVKQVLLNLLSNALKFTPEGGRIDVRAVLNEGRAEVYVTDTGVGIAPEDYEAVFEEFRQVGTADKKVEGTGLGLALSQKFVQLHGGRLWVESQVGVGSTFTFTLPMS
jgi:GAF domain-containing protein/anti-sigma regulatory factor (Ser/Thr protein kinase)